MTGEPRRPVLLTCPDCGSPNGRHTYGCLAPRRRGKAKPATEQARAQTAPVVVNRHHHRGRPMPHPWLYIGRNASDPSKASPLANPYTVQEHGAAALDLYRQWLRERVAAEDPAVMESLRSITPAHSLVCSCAPRPCHGDVVVEVWREVVGDQSAFAVPPRLTDRHLR